MEEDSLIITQPNATYYNDNETIAIMIVTFFWCLRLGSVNIPPTKRLQGLTSQIRVDNLGHIF